MAETQTETLSQLMLDAGFPASAIPTGLAIVQAESGGNANATHKNSNGSTDYGLFQINSVHSSLLSSGDWRSPKDNVAMAYKVWKAAGNSWSPWSTYTSGSYRNYLGNATAAISSEPSTGSSSSGTGLPIETGTSTAKKLAQWAKKYSKIDPIFPASGTSPSSPSSSNGDSDNASGNDEPKKLTDILPHRFANRFILILLGILLLIAGLIILFRKQAKQVMKTGTKVAETAAKFAA